MIKNDYDIRENLSLSDFEKNLNTQLDLNHPSVFTYQNGPVIYKIAINRQAKAVVCDDFPVSNATAVCIAQMSNAILRNIPELFSSHIEKFSRICDSVGLTPVLTFKNSEETKQVKNCTIGSGEFNNFLRKFSEGILIKPGNAIVVTGIPSLDEEELKELSYSGILSKITGIRDKVISYREQIPNKTAMTVHLDREAIVLNCISSGLALKLMDVKLEIDYVEFISKIQKEEGFILPREQFLSIKGFNKDEINKLNTLMILAQNDKENVAPQQILEILNQRLPTNKSVNLQIIDNPYNKEEIFIDIDWNLEGNLALYMGCANAGDIKFSVV
ncbi:MAG: hypothetical protein K0S74_1759 [Chlamydiales bacterium]|jgi:hypothetical protein|nr:hypothetical protein [Chlamydiales bacterium]